MYVLALSDYKQLAAAAGYKPAPQLGRQIAVYIHYPKKYLIVLCISRATNEKNAANAPCCKIK